VCFVFSAIRLQWCWSCCIWVFWFVVVVSDFWFTDYSQSCWALHVLSLVLLTRISPAVICDFRWWARNNRKLVVGDSVMCATATSQLCLVLLVSVVWTCLWFLWLLSRAVELCMFQRYGDASILFEYLSQSLWLTSDYFEILVMSMIDIGLIGLEWVSVACCLAARIYWFFDYSVLTVGSYTK